MDLYFERSSYFYNKLKFVTFCVRLCIFYKTPRGHGVKKPAGYGVSEKTRGKKPIGVNPVPRQTLVTSQIELKIQHVNKSSFWIMFAVFRFT